MKRWIWLMFEHQQFLTSIKLNLKNGTVYGWNGYWQLLLIGKGLVYYLTKRWEKSFPICSTGKHHFAFFLLNNPAHLPLLLIFRFGWPKYRELLFLLPPCSYILIDFEIILLEQIKQKLLNQNSTRSTKPQQAKAFVDSLLNSSLDFRVFFGEINKILSLLKICKIKPDKPYDADDGAEGAQKNA